MRCQHHDMRGRATNINRIAGPFFGPPQRIVSGEEAGASSGVTAGQRDRKQHPRSEIAFRTHLTLTRARGGGENYSSAASQRRDNRHCYGSRAFFHARTFQGRDGRPCAKDAPVSSSLVSALARTDASAQDAAPWRAGILAAGCNTFRRRAARGKPSRYATRPGLPSETAPVGLSFAFRPRLPEERGNSLFGHKERR